MTEGPAALNPPLRVLLGPGPSNVHPRVSQALGAPLVGHLDPYFLRVMDETMALLRYVLQTSNALTLPVSGTGSAGMEAAFANVLEPGDTAVIGVNGLFGQRMCEVAERYGATVVSVEAEWGRALDPDAFRHALRSHPSAKVVAVVHAETSTGVLQPLTEIARITKEHGALFLVDAVTYLGGVDLQVDAWGIDACYSGTQKCLSAPPGLAPLTLSEEARAALHGRSSKVRSWYLDLTLIEDYWGSGRVYHHTAPVAMVYGLREALRLVQEEGLQARFQRHHRNAEALRAGLEALGLRLLVPEGYRADPLTTVLIPESVDDALVRRQLLEEHGIEIGGGLGPLRGRIWRIGLMGESSTAANVLLLLHALGDVLSHNGHLVPMGDALQEASRRLGVA